MRPECPGSEGFHKAEILEIPGQSAMQCRLMPGCYAVFHKQLGDLLLLEPALARLAAHHGAPVRLLTRTGHAPLVGLMDGVTFTGGWPWRPAEAVYTFDPLNKSAWRTLFLPARRRVAILPEKREMAWFHPWVFREIIVPELGDTYVAEYFWTHTPVPARAPFRLPRLRQPPDDWRPTGWGDGPFLLLNPTAGWRQKSWLADRWAAVLATVPADLRIVLTSASTDWQVAHGREITAQAGRRVECLTGSTSLENFLWLCARARAVFTVDGAASHLAQAFGVPSLTVFGPTSLANWHRSTPRHVAVQAPASKDGVRRLRNLAAGPVCEQAAALLA
jgi:ADP-heptose:LPS heptosyltransferase